MQPFEVHSPRTASDAVRLRATLPASMYVAGGTDLLVNLKHGLHAPEHLVSLAAVEELRGIALLEDGTLRIGGGTTLHAVATSETVLREAPGLAKAAGQVAGPQHRRMGTLGGNVMLDTRCLFYNQTPHWRQALGYCLKKDGELCHVIGSTRTCVAAQSSDTVPMLVALGASVAFEGPDGASTVALRDLFHQDGRYERNRKVDEAALLTAVLVPPRPPGHRSTYRKVRTRASIDYPQLGVAVAVDLDGGVLNAIDAVVGAVMPQPRAVRKLERFLGERLTEAAIEAIAEETFKQVHPQTSIHGDPAWRKHMARVEMRRALEELRAG